MSIVIWRRVVSLLHRLSPQQTAPVPLDDQAVAQSFGSRLSRLPRRKSHKGTVLAVHLQTRKDCSRYCCLQQGTTRSAKCRALDGVGMQSAWHSCR